jgi:large subunit ribosomal protein L25
MSSTIDAQLREITGKKVKTLRRQGVIPATIYGKGYDPLTIQLNERSFTQAYRQVGKSSLITLNIEGKPPQQAFIQDVQRHPVKRDILHADFLVVDLKAEMNAEIQIVLVGESPLAARDDAIVNHMLHTVEIHALPANLPHHIEVDISNLDSIDKSICVGDLPAGEKYHFVTPLDTVIVSLTGVYQSQEDAVEEQAPKEAEPALIRKEREEE